MFKRVNKLQIALPTPEHADPNAAAATQELLGGRFGEMSTLNNYLFQSFNFRSKKKLKPFYDLIANIATEEIGHVELVANTINLCLDGSTKSDEGTDVPLGSGLNVRNTHHFIATAQTAIPGNSMGLGWNGDYVFNSGNLVLDLLHNFFLECGARIQKMRVYEMTDHPTTRELCGYLLVRGGVHALAYAKALEEITGVDVKKLLPIPNLDNSKFDEARKYEEQGFHRKLYRFSDEDYRDLNKIWNGPSPAGDGELEVVDGLPEGGPIPDLGEVPGEFAPGFSEEEFMELAKRLQYAASIK